MNYLRSFSIFTFVGFFGAGINFLLMPILSHYLSPTDYGLLALINTYVTILIPLVSFVAYGYITVEYFQLNDKNDFASLFSSVAFIPIIPTTILFLCGFFGYQYFSEALELPANGKWWAMSMFLIATLSVYSETLSSYQIIIKDSKFYAVYNISRVLVEVSLTLIFVVYMGMGWKGRILSWLLTSIVFLGLAFIYFHKKHLLTWQIKWKYIWAGVLFGAPLILHTLGKFVVNQSDRLFIAKMVSLNEAGIYSVGYTIGTIMLIGATALSNVAAPFVMERLKQLDTESEKQIRRFTLLGIAVLVGILMVLNLLSPFLFKYFIDDRYIKGNQYVFWVSLGYLFWGIYMFFCVYIYYYKKTKYLIYLAFVNILTNITFNYFFICKFGGIGAAYATALSFFINLILMLVKVARMLPWLRFRFSDFKC